MQFIKNVSAYLLRFSYGKFVETLGKEKVNIYWSCRTKRLIWSEVFCFYNCSTEMMYPLELNCTEYLLRVLPREIVLMKSDASSVPFINTSTFIYLFIFLFLINILPSFKKCSMVLKQNYSKGLRVLYSYFLSSEGWE